MSMRPSELALVAAEVNRELVGAVVQKVAAPTTRRVYLELRKPGRTVTLLTCSEDNVARISCVDQRPLNPPRPPAWQSVLRRELTGARIVDAEHIADRNLFIIHFKKSSSEDALAFILEISASAPSIVLTTAGKARILAKSIPSREGLALNRQWEPPPAVTTISQAPSRLSGDHVELRMLHASEALFATVEQTQVIAAHRSPLEAKLKRLRRTRAKIESEAARGPLAEQYQREAIVLTRHQRELKRGMTSVTLSEYRADGTEEQVTIALDPARAPKQEIEWRFHQHRRLMRGVTIARERLAQLDRDEAALCVAISEIAAGTLPPQPSTHPAAPRAKQATHSPFREFIGAGGQRIWVGKGARDNDQLTFHIARPFHTWLHVRGVAGAHVVVPLSRGSIISSEILIDAAHLALHFSDSRSEPRAEITYVPVKHLRKPRDGAPGAVFYTGEKTLLLRTEPDRLKRLLHSEVDAPSSRD